VPGTERAMLKEAPIALPRGGRESLPFRAGGTGVRGRGVDAMMLRSAEADPHVIEHTTRPEAEAPDVVA